MPDITGCYWRRVTSRGGCLEACCTGSRRCRHQQDSMNRRPKQISVPIETGEGKVSEKCVGNATVFDLAFFRNRRKGSAAKNLAGALHADRVGCTLSVAWEVKMEIPAYSSERESTR